MTQEESQSMFYGATPEIFRRATMLRNNMTEPEKELWKHLSDKKLNGYKFRRQHPISTYVADFYCHNAQLAIEIDGQNHNHGLQKTNDCTRDDEMIELGIRIMRFTNEEVMKDIKMVISKIESALNS